MDLYGPVRGGVTWFADDLYRAVRPRGLYARFYQDTVANICRWLDGQAVEAVGVLNKEEAKYCQVTPVFSAGRKRLCPVFAFSGSPRARCSHSSAGDLTDSASSNALLTVNLATPRQAP